MSGLQSCSRIFEKSSAVAENKIPENLTFSEKSEKKNARIIPPLTLHGQQHCSTSIFNALPCSDYIADAAETPPLVSS
jgi:hypothetical protein